MRGLRQRRWLRVLVLVGLPVLTLTIVLWIIVAPADKVTESSSQKIRRSMTKAQVEAILGGPGEEVDYSKVDRVVHWKWEGRDGSVHVLFRDGAADSEGQFIQRMDATVCGVIRRLFWSIFEDSPAPRVHSRNASREAAARRLD
jgi:hypothetical protein